MEIKRLTAQKSGIAEIIKGKFVKKTGFESNYVLTNLGRKISRVRVLGLIVDKFVSDDNNYATITLDDETETIRCKVFVNVKIFESFEKGDLADVVGKLREYNGEIYIAPEILKKMVPDFQTLRLLELSKIASEQKKAIKKTKELQKQVLDANELKILAKQAGISPSVLEGILEAEEMIQSITEQKTLEKADTKNKILKIVETQDKGDGVDYQAILQSSKLPENAVDTAIQELLESGICFEPRAGKIKKI